MIRLLAATSVLGMLGLITACSGPVAENYQEPSSLNERLPTVATAGGRAEDGKWGTVKGRIVFGGDAMPEIRKIDVTKDPEHCLSKGPLNAEEWVINEKNKGIRWTFVWLVPEDEKGKLAIHPDLVEITKKEVEIDQPCCKFERHAVALRKGQVLIAKNTSPVGHNVDWKGIRQPGGNTSVPAGGKLIIDQMKVSDYPISFSCGSHPWMKGWARVFDHPYYAVTDADGNFEIKNAPVGKCRMVVWQEAVGYRPGTDKKGEPVEIKVGEATDLGKIEIKPRKE